MSLGRMPIEDDGIFPFIPARHFTRVPVLRGLTEIAGLNRLIAQRGFIAGGYARYCLSPLLNPPKFQDIDIFLIQKNHLDPVKESLTTNGFEIIHENDISFTFHYSKFESSFLALPNVQLIKPITNERVRTYGKPQEVLPFFDFSIGSVALQENGGYVDQDFIKDEANLNLRIVHIIDPLATINRIGKYFAKGYKISPKEVIKLYLHWDSISPEYKEEIVKKIEGGPGGGKMPPVIGQYLVELS